MCPSAFVSLLSAARARRLDARRRKKETSASLQARDAARQKRWKEGVEKTAVWREEGGGVNQ